MKKPSNFTDSDWEKFDQEEIIKKYNYGYTNTVMWVLSAVAVVLLLAAFQSSEEDKAKCQQVQSNDTCEFYLH